MLSEDAKRELRQAGASQALRRDFQALGKNLRRIDAKMSLDDFISFLTASERLFAGARRIASHSPYPRALI